MNRKLVFSLLGLSLILLIICGVSVGFGMLLYSFSNSTGGGFGGGDAVAIVRVEGTILTGDAPVDFFGEPLPGAYSNTIVEQLQWANDSERVKAVLLYVDSPGGGVLPSDLIYKQITEMEKPVVVWMGSLAASGGYYISAPATEIWASRHTLTGSLGVIIQLFNISGFMEEYGLEATSITSGEFKDSGSLFKEMSAEERVIWQSLVDESYQIFVDIIAEGREMDEETVLELADGRIYSALQAQELGLVDEIGYLDEAIKRAAELGGVEGEPSIIDYGATTTSISVGSLFGFGQPASPYQTLQELKQLHQTPMLMYLYTGE